MMLTVSILVLGHSLPGVQALSTHQAGSSVAHHEQRSFEHSFKFAKQPKFKKVNSRQASQGLGNIEPLSFLSVDQQPSPQYVSYGKPQFTTFNNATSACQACVTFWPAKEDGKRFHSKLYEDASSGGEWARSCHAGQCDFRDPQTDPVGGVIGRGVGPNGMPDGKTCITRAPVPWFTDCEDVLLESTHTVLDATRYCSYREQIFIPPPAGTVSRFADKPAAWARIGGNQESCLKTIEKEGAALLDEMNFCDSDMPALSGCCETVYSALTCLGETSTHAGMSKEDVFSAMNSETAQMMETFSKYCAPLCQNTKETFCAKNPGADICKNPKGCTDCTKQGGLWCPQLESCHCPSKNPPCIKPPITTPLQCFESTDYKKNLRGGEQATIEAGAGDGLVGDDNEPACKYSEMARKWKQRD